MRRPLVRYVRMLWVGVLLLTVAAWVLSYFNLITLVIDRFDGPHDRFCCIAYRVESLWGAVLLRRDWYIEHRDVNPLPVPRPWKFHSYWTKVQRAGSRVQLDKPHFLGFQFAGQPFTGPTFIDRTKWIVLPYWFLVLVLSIPPSCWTVRHYRLARRRKLGHCFTCGYDLRASTDRCPECGTAIVATEEGIE